MNHSSQALAARLVRLLLLCLAIAGYLAASVPAPPATKPTGTAIR
jgi:hypothetical protein